MKQKLLLLIPALFMLASFVSAYIDPGTGGVLFNTIWPLIVTFFAAASAFMVKIFWTPIKKLFKRKTKQKLLVSMFALFLLALPIAFPAIDYTAQEINDSLNLVWGPTELTQDDGPYGRTGTNNGGVELVIDGTKVGGKVGYFDDSVNNPIVFANDANMNNCLGNFTLTFITNVTTEESDTFFTARGNPSSGPIGEWYLAGRPSLSQLLFAYRGDASINTGWSSVPALFDGNHDNLVSLVVNITGGTAYIYVSINGTTVAEGSGASSIGCSNQDLVIGDRNDDTAGERFRGSIYQYCYFEDVALSNSDIREHIWRDGNFVRCIEIGKPLLDLTPPTFSDDGINNTAPRENYVVNINITITDEVNVSGFIFSWDGGTGTFVNDTFIFLTGEALTITNVSVDKTIPSVPAGTTIQYQWFANDTLGNMGNSSVFSLLIAGTTAPVLTINPTNFFNADNSTYLSLADTKKVLLNLTLTDDIGLFGIEMNITNADGVECFYYSNISLSTLTDNVSVILNITSSSNADCLVEGNYMINITGWDSHTSTVISKYKVDTGNNYLVFDDTIRISADNARTSKATKLEDRYTFEFTYRTWFTPKTKVFYIESDNILTYKTIGYKAHFVDWKEKKWIDFEGIEGQPIVTKINDYKYRIEYANEDEKVVFNSIGGLNQQSDYFKYYLSNIIVDWIFPTTTPSFFTNNSITIRLNVSGKYRNETRFKIYNSSHDLINSFNISNNGTGDYFYNYTFTRTFTQIPYYVNATHYDLTGFATNSTTLAFVEAYFNVLFYDEAVTTLITDLVNLEIVGTEFAANYSTTSGKIQVPGWILEEYKLVYTSAQYPIREYYVTFTNITNQSLSLYMLSTSNGTDVTFSVQDNSGNPLTAATIYLKKYYVSTNSYRTVAMIRTNEEGDALIDVDFNDAYYQILVTYGEFSLQTIGSRIISLTRILTLDLIPDPFGIADAITGVTTSLTFNKVTQTFSYVFTDTNGVSRTGTLDVIKTTATTSENVCTNTETSVSGTVLCTYNTTKYPGTYTAKGYISINPKLLTDTLQLFTGIKRDFKNIFGTQGIFFTILIAGALGGLGAAISPAVGMIMFMVGIVFASFMGMSIMSMVFVSFLVIAMVVIIFRMKR